MARRHDDFGSLLSRRREKQGLGINVDILAIKQQPRQRLIIARHLPQGAHGGGVEMGGAIGGERAQHLDLVARRERANGFARRIGPARDRRGEFRGTMTRVGDDVGDGRVDREFKGDARAGAALVEQTADDAGRGFGMFAKRLGDQRDAVSIAHIDQIAREPFELSQFRRSMLLARHELIDDLAQQFPYRRVSRLLIAMHRRHAPSLNAKRLCHCISRLLTQH